MGGPARLACAQAAAAGRPRPLAPAVLGHVCGCVGVASALAGLGSISVVEALSVPRTLTEHWDARQRLKKAVDVAISGLY